MMQRDQLSSLRRKPQTRVKTSKKGVISLVLALIILLYVLFTSVIVTRNLAAKDATDSHKDWKVRGFEEVKNPPSTISTDTSVEEIKLSNDDDSVDNEKAEKVNIHENDGKDSPRLTAYIEPIYQEDWAVKPLPIRNTTSTDLTRKVYDKLYSCTRLPEQWPTDDTPTVDDPYLPWIHDVFPTEDGKYIQFVAQNRRRCQSGTKMTEIKTFMQPNVALFQHVPVKRVNITEDGTRYRLSTHEEADKDAVEARFICRFKPSMEETLSVHNFNYDWVTLRKRYYATFTFDGFDNHMIWSSQLLFRCPVPPSLQETVRLGTSVINDYSTLFVDLVPIRTPPRYGDPDSFLPPHFGKEYKFNASAEWGSNHILPKIEDSGRWENVPICKPSLLTYQEDTMKNVQQSNGIAAPVTTGEKKYDLVACTWTSASFHTRGARTHVTDGMRRLREWIEFNKLAGVDHIYIYDNSARDLDSETLKPVTDLFPEYVTRINWPAKICNNNPGTGDNKGERSSQYAAESSCMLRFGPHTEWFGSFDTDEYLVPMGENKDLKDILKKLKDDDTRVLSFKSKRSKPRVEYFDTTQSKDTSCGKQDCFDPDVPQNKTFLEVYNCNIEKPPRKKTMPAEKQIYRPDYVLQHFVHYSAVTTELLMNEKEFKEAKFQWRRRYNDQHHRFSDELTEGTMLHTKAIVASETRSWKRGCNTTDSPAKVGIPFPRDKDNHTNGIARMNIKGKGSFVSNCYPIESVDDYWGPKLNDALYKS